MSGLLRCPKCKRNTLRCKVSLFLDIDMAAYHRLSKKMVATRHVRFEGADWPNELLYCERDGCGYLSSMGTRRQSTEGTGNG